jgi:predicted transcriptional regulator YheO
MNSDLHAFRLLADSIARLFAPHAEIVLHDLTTGTIAHIANCFSKRRPGDSSLLDIVDLNFDQAIIGPYTKTNWDGRRLKSVSTVIRDENDKPIGLMCINHDIEAFSLVLEQLSALVTTAAAPLRHATDLFAADWRERINDEITAFLTARNMTLAGLDPTTTEVLIGQLDRSGFFGIRNATTYIADILGVSRATLYNRLNAARRVAKSHRTGD